MATPTNSNRGRINIAVLIWPIIYLSALIALPIIRNEFSGSIPHYILYPFYNMPLSVLWFGALGGLLVSMYRIFAHRDWQNPFHLWYAFSGILGAIYGLISYLLVVLLINATTISNHFDRTTVAYDVIAFLMGFSQNAFQDLIRRMTGLTFGAGRVEDSEV